MRASRCNREGRRFIPIAIGTYRVHKNNWMAHFVYILYSVSLDLYYIGSSANPEERLRKHLANHHGFTSRAKDWVICYSEPFSDRSEAIKRERLLKSWKNREKIQLLIKNNKKL